MSKSLRPIRYFNDAKGNRCAGVQLANCNLEAILYAADLAKLQALGVSLNWHVNSNGTGDAYVKVALPGKDTRVVARLIAEAAFKQQVHYRNGNRLDLRRDNLRVGAGGKAHKDCTDLHSLEGLNGTPEQAE